MIFCVFQNDRKLKNSIKYIYLFFFFYSVSTRAPSINDVTQCPPTFDTLHSISLKKKKKSVHEVQQPDPACCGGVRSL